MSKSEQAFVAATQGTQFTLYATMKAMGIPLSEEQKKVQAHLERLYPPVVCPHSRTTIISDKKYCVDCGKEILE